MEKRKQPDRKSRLIDWKPDPTIAGRQLAYDFKVRGLAFDIQRQHGLEPETKIYLEFGRLNLTQAMTGLIEGFKDALFSELAELPPRALPPGLLPVLIEKLREDRVASVLAALQAAGKRLYEEDRTPLTNVTRFLAALRDGEKRQ